MIVFYVLNMMLEKVMDVYFISLVFRELESLVFSLLLLNVIYEIFYVGYVVFWVKNELKFI